MTKNTLLRITIVICRIFQILSIVAFLLVIITTIRVQVTPSDFKTTKIFTNNTNPMISYTSIYTMGSDNIHRTEYYLSEATTSSLFFNCIKFSIIILLLFLCITELLKIIYSLKHIQTFRQRNVLSFRKIGKYLLIVFVFSIFNFWDFTNGGFFKFTIELTFPILSLTAFILAEIFKEGNKLQEENQLTV